MFYQIQEDITRIPEDAINPEVLTLGIITLEKLEQSYEKYGFSYLTLADCKNNNYHITGNFDTYPDYIFGIIVGINSNQTSRLKDRIAMYIKKNLLLIVIIEDEDESIRLKLYELLEHITLPKINLERLIYGYLERLIYNDNDLLDKFEEDISNYEDRINAKDIDKDFNYKITEIRKKLLLLDNYYQQYIAIGEELEENSADLFNEENLHYFRIFADRATRLSNNTRMLQDFSVHVREAYHAKLEYDLNKIMKIFTVVTTIFLPLTLIVGWYGMNFTSMPELTWRYGYLYVIILSIIVAVICILYFKKKKFI